MRAFPLNGRVPIARHMHRITIRRQDPAAGWCYTLVPLDHHAGPCIVLAHAEVIARLAAYARYAVGQRVMVDAFRDLPITERRWKFHLGITVYYIRMPSSTAHRRRFAEDVLVDLERMALLGGRSPASPG